MAYIHSPAEKVNSQRTLWARALTLVMGFWLIVNPMTFDYASPRMHYNDIIIGILVVIFGWFDFVRPRPSLRWILFILGAWLQLAPLVFLAPNSVAYLNDTLVGALIICLTIIVPTTDELLQSHVQEIPPGWSYNPSSWPQRVPIALFGLIGWFIARYMASYQLGYIHQVWDPFFGEGTLKVITSNISRAFPVSDAGLGAAAYTLEALLACKGGTSRWRTSPWLVLFFGILVIPLGFISILLIMLQPLAVGYWCGWCLLTAFCMLVMIALTLDEVVAVFDYLRHIKKEGKSVREVFWRGGSSPTSKTVALPSINAPLEYSFPAMVRGVSIPWNLGLLTLIGVWQLFGMNFHQESGLDDAIDHVCGALIVVISVIAWAEVARGFRFVNYIVALVLLFNVIFIKPHDLMEMSSDAIVIILLIALSFRKGPIKEKYGAWQNKII